MKKIFSVLCALIIAISLSLTVIGCGEEETIYNSENSWDDDGVLRILAVGNSFSVDSMEYVYKIAKAMGVEKVELGNLYIGGCTLETHLEKAQTGHKAYGYYYADDCEKLSIKGTSKYSTAIEDSTWDFITFQQGSEFSGIADSYSSLTDLIEITKPLCKNPNVKFAWHMTWAYQGDSTHEGFAKYDRNQTTMYQAIVSAVQSKIVTNSDISYIIPNGTAIQNARTSYLGDTLTRDGHHLSYDKGRLIAGFTTLASLIGMKYDKLDFAKIVGDEKFAKVVKESVKNAIDSPFSVTNSQITA